MAQDINALKTMMLADMQKALDSTILILIEELKKFIKENLYDTYSPIRYERTFEVLDLWTSNPSEITGNMVKSTIYPEYSSLHTNRSKGQHIITGETLIDMLLMGYGTKSQPFNIPRDFFTPFIEFVNKNVDDIFKKEMDKINKGINSSINIKFS